jgi:cupin 2 domain-containing protein
MTDNLFSDLPVDLDLAEELIEVIEQNAQVRIERIVSTGHSSPEGFWYDSDQPEWVAVLKGEAKLLLAGDNEPLHMRPGDHVTIPAHQKHRVEWTSADEPTVWLAVYFDESPREVID